MRATNLRQETLDSIAQWEYNNNNEASGSSVKSLDTTFTVVDSVPTGLKSTSASVKSTESHESILTMSALEYVLERNPAPLQEFSSRRDFSGENVAFLTCVTEWKASLPQTAGDGIKYDSTRQLVRERFNRAVRIYADFISTNDAEFPINISSSELKKLQNVFESSARILYGNKRDVDPVAPFDFARAAPQSADKGFEKAPNEDDKPLGARVQSWGEIPESFDGAVFDEAEKHIKYLVLTNTWPKFVKDRRSLVGAQKASESGRSVIQMVCNRSAQK